MDLEIDIQDFIDEAEEQIRILNEGLLVLEKDQKNDSVIDELFRSAHTLKGGSALVGFGKMTELTHKLESIFDLIRNKELDLNSDHLDVMFESLDVLMELMAVVGSNEDSVDIQTVSDKLEAILKYHDADENKNSEQMRVDLMEKDDSVQEPAESEILQEDNRILDFRDNEDGLYEFIKRHIAKEIEDSEFENVLVEIDDNKNLYLAQFIISETCLATSLFIFMLFNKIREIGTLIAENPTEEQAEEEDIFKVNVLFSSILEEEDFIDGFKMPDVEDIKIYKVSSTVSVDDQDVSVEPTVSSPAAVEATAFSSATVESTVSETADNLSVLVHEPAVLVKDKKIEPKTQRSASHTLRVDSLKIDLLLNLVGELVVSKARFVQIADDFEKVFGRHPKIVEYKEALGFLVRTTNDLQEGIMQLRMMPIDVVFNKFPRVIRDMSRKLKKQIRLDIIGKDTELDKSVIEEISDPLMHLIRNSVDHGVEFPDERKNKGKKEEGRVILKSYHQGNSIVIEVQDDGKGISIDKIKETALKKDVVTEDDLKMMSDKDIYNLIFMPGFSTVEKISDISGRGVGMDVVKKNIEKLNGAIDIITELDKGSSFIIKLPLTLAIISTLLVKVTSYIYAIPLVNVVEIVEIEKKEISKIGGQEAITIRNDVINIVHLDEIFCHGTTTKGRDRLRIVIVAVADNKIGFVVEQLVGEQEVVIKALDNKLLESPGVAGASILGDGSVTLVVDVPTLIEKVILESV